MDLAIKLTMKEISGFKDLIRTYYPTTSTINKVLKVGEEAQKDKLEDVIEFEEEKSNKKKSH